jgi:hypothetical protein
VQPQVVYGQHSPSYPQQPIYGQSSTTTSSYPQQPPVYGQSPSYPQQPPIFGQSSTTTSSYPQQPPIYGQQPSTSPSLGISISGGGISINLSDRNNSSSYSIGMGGMNFSIE